MSEVQRIDRAAEFIRASLQGRIPTVGIVLGSGLGAIANRLEDAVTIAYRDIPGFHPSGVEGHAGRLSVGRLGGAMCAVMQGRIHLYEGHAVADVVLPVRVLVRLGARDLVITNAAGGISPDLRVGQLMLISDHLNLTARNPLLGRNEDALGVRFPDMSNAYDAERRTTAKAAARSLGIDVREGVYAGLLGPSYETPAEIRMLRTLGADAVGMSTVLEAIAAHHMGARILGISCVSNAAAGLADARITHEEVKAAADAVQDDLAALLTAVIERYQV